MHVGMIVTSKNTQFHSPVDADQDEARINIFGILVTDVVAKISKLKLQ